MACVLLLKLKSLTLTSPNKRLGIAGPMLKNNKYVFAVIVMNDVLRNVFLIYVPEAYAYFMIAALIYEIYFCNGGAGYGREPE
jgi:hypothetical protein